jgi:hypothetical protein
MCAVASSGTISIPNSIKLRLAALKYVEKSRQTDRTSCAGLCAHFAPIVQRAHGKEKWA